MKVLATIVVDVDVQAYREEYGTDDPTEDIREDIRLRMHDAAEWELRNHKSFVRSIELKP